MSGATDGGGGGEAAKKKKVRAPPPPPPPAVMTASAVIRCSMAAVVGQKLGGTWYSTPDEAQCPATEGSATRPCSWRATPVKRVSKRCHDASMANYILSLNNRMRQDMSQCDIPAGYSDEAATFWPFVVSDAPIPTDTCWLRTYSG